MRLSFIIEGQELMLHPADRNKKLVSDAQKAWSVYFEYRALPWRKGKVFAQFDNGDDVFEVELGKDHLHSQRECLIPSEVMSAPGFKLMLRGESGITSSQLYIPVEASGLSQEPVVLAPGEDELC